MRKVIILSFVIALLLFNAYLMSGCKNNEKIYDTNVTYLDDNHCTYAIGVSSMFR